MNKKDNNLQTVSISFFVYILKKSKMFIFYCGITYIFAMKRIGIINKNRLFLNIK
ncbi:hypothetical protein HMPREF9018_0596 [Prevotella amnii CRIS 21A-A]|nr:hypothetical protein HMPREF9018_0596 [Prevotella amnii CRIS 21A-A]